MIDHRVPDQSVGKCLVWLMAGGAASGPGARQDRIGEEFFSQGDLFSRAEIPGTGRIGIGIKSILIEEGRGILVQQAIITNDRYF